MSFVLSDGCTYCDRSNGFAGKPPGTCGSVDGLGRVVMGLPFLSTCWYCARRLPLASTACARPLAPGNLPYRGIKPPFPWEMADNVIVLPHPRLAFFVPFGNRLQLQIRQLIGVVGLRSFQLVRVKAEGLQRGDGNLRRVHGVSHHGALY